MLPGRLQRLRSTAHQGYVSEHVYVSSPLAGTLETLSVRRGDRISGGVALFALDAAPEKAARDEAERKLAMNRANWEDLKKGKRPSEIDSLEAQLKQATSSLALSEKLLARQESLIRTNSTSKEDLDRARSTYDQDRQRVAQLTADLQTARLGARADQIAAAEAMVRASEAALARVEWDLAQRPCKCAQGGIVFDTLYRPGEWVAAGRPIVASSTARKYQGSRLRAATRSGAVKVGQKARQRGRRGRAVRRKSEFHFPAGRSTRRQ